MALRLGTNEISKIYLGSNEVNKAYLGSNLIFDTTSGGNTIVGDPTLPINLVTYYKFDADANDSVGSNNGTVNGATLTTGNQGIIGEAYDFNGVNNTISLTTADNLGIDGTDFSINFWTNLDAVGTNQMGVSNNDGLTGDLDFYACRTNNRVLVFVRGGPVLESTSTRTTGTWVMTTLVKEGSTYRLYYNAVEEDSATSSQTIQTTDPVVIGALRNSSAFLNGRFDESAFYGKALQPDEITRLYAGGAGLPYD